MQELGKQQSGAKGFLGIFVLFLLGQIVKFIPYVSRFDILVFVISIF